MAITKQVVLHNLLADLFDDASSRLDFMKSDTVTSEMIPDEFRLEREVLKGLEECDRKGEPSTPMNVALMSLSRNPKMQEFCETLAGQANSIPMIHANAVWFRSWIQQDRLSKAAEEIQKLAQMDYSDAAEKQEMMLDRLISVPIEHSKQSYTRVELIERLEEEQAKRVKAREQGKALGAILHVDGLRKVAPVLAGGDLTLFTAPPKAGKTTVGMILAEINALENDIDVLWLLLETSPNTIEERFLARDLLIPGYALREGLVDLTKPPFVKAHQRYKQEQREQWDTLGHIHLQYVAGSRLSEIAGQIRIHKRMADIRNRPLLVIIDYLQRIAKPVSKNEVEALAAISNYIKDLAVQYECHIVLFSQESFSAEGRAAGDSRAHGSNTPIFVAQLHIAMRVLNCSRTWYINDENGDILKDRMGNDRRWQTQGKNKRQSVVRFDLMRANDNESDNVFAAFENNMFIMLDISNPVVQIPTFMQMDIARFPTDMQDSERRLI